VVVIEDFPLQRFIRWDHKSALGKPKFEVRGGGGFLKGEVEFRFPL
jgi:hypothetical protein